jgi:hypothetical protein
MRLERGRLVRSNVETDVSVALDEATASGRRVEPQAQRYNWNVETDVSVALDGRNAIGQAG